MKLGEYERVTVVAALPEDAEGALLLDNIDMGQGCLQIGISMVVGLFFSYLVYLEETRAARRRR